MSIDPERLKKLVELFQSAEAKVKAAEQDSSEIAIPSINELRYFGYHLAKALSESDAKEVEEQITRAERHCKRAIYDAAEAGISYYLEQIALFQDEYRKDPHVTEAIGDYAKLCVTAESAADFIIQVRDDNLRDREEFYETCSPHLDDVRAVYRELTRARSQINALTAKHNRSVRLAFATIAISLLGAVAVWANVWLSTHEATACESMHDRCEAVLLNGKGGEFPSEPQN